MYVCDGSSESVDNYQSDRGSIVGLLQTPLTSRLAGPPLSLNLTLTLCRPGLLSEFTQFF